MEEKQLTSILQSMRVIAYQTYGSLYRLMNHIEKSQARSLEIDLKPFRRFIMEYLFSLEKLSPMSRAASSVNGQVIYLENSRENQKRLREIINQYLAFQDYMRAVCATADGCHYNDLVMTQLQTINHSFKLAHLELDNLDLLRIKEMSVKRISL